MYKWVHGLDKFCSCNRNRGRKTETKAEIEHEKERDKVRMNKRKTLTMNTRCAYQGQITKHNASIYVCLSMYLFNVSAEKTKLK